MKDLSTTAQEVAAAISQQNILASELSQNLHGAVNQVVSASDGYRAAAELMRSAGAETASLRDAAGILSRISGALVGEVDSFADQIRST